MSTLRKEHGAPVLRYVVRPLEPARPPPVLFIADFLARRHGLTPTERRILRLFVSGCDRADLAGRMELSENTVRTHVRSLCRKLGIGGLEQVYRLLLREALLGWSPRTVAFGAPP